VDAAVHGRRRVGEIAEPPSALTVATPLRGRGQFPRRAARSERAALGKGQARILVDRCEGQFRPDRAAGDLETLAPIEIRCQPAAIVAAQMVRDGDPIRIDDDVVAKRLDSAIGTQEACALSCRGG